MSSPEIYKPEGAQETIKTPDSLVEVGQALSEQGVTVHPVQPASVSDSSGKVVVSSVGADVGYSKTPTITVPFSFDEAERISHGDITNSKTWMGVFFLRKIKQAVMKGISVVVGTSAKGGV